MYPQSLLNQLNKLTGQQQTLQNQVSTGLRVQEASDDPAAARKMIQWQTDMSGLNQFRKNIAAQQDLAKMNHGLVQSLNNISSRGMSWPLNRMTPKIRKPSPFMQKRSTA